MAELGHNLLSTTTLGLVFFFSFCRRLPLHKTTVGMTVRMMLDSNGFSSVRVQGSDIPVRF